MSLTATDCTRPAESDGRTFFQLGPLLAHFFPQYGAKLESHYAVEHASRLLGVDAVYVDAPRVGYGVEYGVFCYFVEHYATRVVGVESEHFIEVPGYGFSLAVFIGSQPDRLGLCRGFP